MRYETSSFGRFANYETWAFHVLMTYDKRALKGFHAAADRVRSEVEHECKSTWRRPGSIAEEVLPVAFGLRLREMNARAFAFEAAEPLREASRLVDWEAIAAAILEAPANSGRVPLFTLGKRVMTQGARMEVSPLDASVSLVRHIRGDWGELGEGDREENDRSLHEGDRILSRYRTKGGTSFYVITERDRSATTLLLPEEY